MRILDAEIKLREATREAEQIRDHIEYDEQVEKLSETQMELGGRTVEVILKIEELPDGKTEFAREIALLTRVVQVMNDAVDILEEPHTGRRAIAAETEVIELLLRTRRINPNGGGGGGSNPGGGGTGTTSAIAQALAGAGNEKDAHRTARSVRHETGKAGKELPAGFRHGLDQFLNRPLAP